MHRSVPSPLICRYRRTNDITEEDDIADVRQPIGNEFAANTSSSCEQERENERLQHSVRSELHQVRPVSVPQREAAGEVGLEVGVERGQQRSVEHLLVGDVVGGELFLLRGVLRGFRRCQLNNNNSPQ